MIKGERHLEPLSTDKNNHHVWNSALYLVDMLAIRTNHRAFLDMDLKAGGRLSGTGTQTDIVGF